MLKTFESTEKYIVENGVCYAVCEELGKKRRVNGCEVRKELDAEYASFTAELEALQKQITLIKQKCAANRVLDSQLSVSGYCLMDEPVYKRVDGMLVRDAAGDPMITTYTHSAVCERKGD